MEILGALFIGSTAYALVMVLLSWTQQVQNKWDNEDEL